MNHSNGMNEIVACLLILAGLGGWSYPGIRSVGSGTPQEAAASESTSPVPAVQNGDAGQVSIRNDLVDVETPTHKLKLAEDSEIRLFVHARGLTNVGIMQAQRGINTRLYFDVPESYATVPVIYQADGSAVIHVTPLRLGEVGLVIRGGFGAFPNSTLFVKRVKLDVEPPSRQPLKVFAAEGAGQNGTPRILLYLQNNGGQKFLMLHAIYDGVKQPIPIDPSAVAYRLRTNGESSPVELDRSTGLLTPIHLGDAIIETRFAGLETLTCIVVDEKMSVDYLSMCKELLKPGKQLTREK